MAEVWEAVTLIRCPDCKRQLAVDDSEMPPLIVLAAWANRGAWAGNTPW